MTPARSTLAPTDVPRSRNIFGSAIRPSPQTKVAGLIQLGEGGDKGFIGRYCTDPSVVIEVCFSWDSSMKRLGETPLFSIIIMRGKKTIFEFFNGATVKMPSRDEAAKFLLPLLHAFDGYWPKRIR